MDILLYVVALVVVLIGLIGCIIPAIPGPPISFIGLLIVHWTKSTEVSSDLLWITGVAMVVVTVLDYVVPIWGTKKFGGSKYGTWGSMIGLIVGLFFGPIGIIIGPFLGAFVGELIYGRTQEDAFRSGLGSFIGFLLGTGLKIIVSGYIFFLYWKYAIVAIGDLF
jgi:uncharacterized protein YqgC (DUF456 family)